MERHKRFMLASKDNVHLRGDAKQIWIGEKWRLDNRAI